MSKEPTLLRSMALYAIFASFSSLFSAAAGAHWLFKQRVLDLVELAQDDSSHLVTHVENGIASRFETRKMGPVGRYRFANTGILVLEDPLGNSSAAALLDPMGFRPDSPPTHARSLAVVDSQIHLLEWETNDESNGADEPLRAIVYKMELDGLFESLLDIRPRLPENSNWSFYNDEGQVLHSLQTRPLSGDDVLETLSEEDRANLFGTGEISPRAFAVERSVVGLTPAINHNLLLIWRIPLDPLRMETSIQAAKFAAVQLGAWVCFGALLLGLSYLRRRLGKSNVSPS